MLPPPVLETSNAAGPPVKTTVRLSGVTTRTGGLFACTSVTVWGLPVAPIAVTVTTPVRIALSWFGSALTVMVPELLPLLPEVIRSQAAPVVTDAVQFREPPPVFITEYWAVPPASPMLC